MIYKYISVILLLLQFSTKGVAQAKLDIDSLTQLVQKKQQELQRHSEIKTFDFVGGGDLNAAKQEDNGLGSGSISLGMYLFRQFKPDKTRFLKNIEIDFAINVASSLDSIAGNPINGAFGNNILQPINNKFSARLDMVSFFKEDVKKTRKYGQFQAIDEKIMVDSLQQVSKKLVATLKKKGISNPKASKEYQKLQKLIFEKELEMRDSIAVGRMHYANSKAKRTLFNDIVEGAYFNLYSDRTTWMRSDSLISSNATNLHLKLGIFHEFLPNALAIDNEVSVRLGLGYSFRAILGDISQGNADDRQLINFIGTSEKTYHGLDLNFTVKFNQIKAEFSIPFIFKKDNEIPGLTNTQFIANIRFVGGFPLGL